MEIFVPLVSFHFLVLLLYFSIASCIFLHPAVLNPQVEEVATMHRKHAVRFFAFSSASRYEAQSRGF